MLKVLTGKKYRGRVHLRPTKTDVVAGFIPAFLLVFASPDLSGRSNLG